MNNNSFSLFRYLLDAGYDAYLLLFDYEHQHFSPSSDAFGFLETERIIQTRLSYGPSALWNISKTEIKKIFDPFSFIISCGTTPAYLSLINRKCDVFVPYGSDIYKLPFAWPEPISDIKAQIKHAFFRFHQRRGIKNSDLILMDYTNPDYESLFANLKIGSKRIYTAIPFLFMKEYAKKELVRFKSDSVYFKEFLEIRNNADLMIFSHVRQEWDSNGVSVTKEFHSKGNQKLIYAVKKLVDTENNIRIKVVFFEYGTKVANSKQLIAELGLESYFEWMPLMSRKEIMLGITLADIGVAELDASYFSYGAVYEFLAEEVPVIHYREDEMYRPFKPSMYPMFSANSSEMVFNHLKKFISNPSQFKNVGIEANKWFMENAIEKPLKLIYEKIESRNFISGFKG
jgi:hypothetical protein